MGWRRLLVIGQWAMQSLSLEGSTSLGLAGEDVEGAFRIRSSRSFIPRIIEEREGQGQQGKKRK
jgi:hypothetical protein